MTTIARLEPQKGLARTGAAARRRPMRSRRARARGLTLLEVLLAVGVAAAISATVVYSITERAADLRAKAAADQMSLVVDAADLYIRNNLHAYTEDAKSQGGPIGIDPDDLVTAGYLPSQLLDNPYGQHYGIWVRPIEIASPGDLGNPVRTAIQAMVVTLGGEDPGRTRLSAIALQTKKSSGFVIHEPWTGANENLILGPFGGWRAQVSDFRPGGAEPVWLATLLPLNDEFAANDYLYRGEVPGRPDLNEMRTDIRMTNGAGMAFDDRGDAKIDIRVDPADSSRLVINNGGMLFDIDGDTPSIHLNSELKTVMINGDLEKNRQAADDAVANGLDDVGDVYNLYVDGSANIAQHLHVGGNTNIAGNTNLMGDLNVAGDTSLQNTTVTGLFTVEGDAIITGNLDLRNCLAVGLNGAAPDPTACLDVGTSGRPIAARFRGNVKVDTDLAARDIDASRDIDAVRDIRSGRDVTAAGNMRAFAYFYNSDARLKDNIRPIDNALDRLLEVQGVQYDWKRDGRADLGVIAQNVEQVFPELVIQDEAGIRAVEYGNMVAPIIEAIRELDAENKKLRAEIDASNGASTGSR